MKNAKKHLSNKNFNQSLERRGLSRTYPVRESPSLNLGAKQGVFFTIHWSHHMQYSSLYLQLSKYYTVITIYRLSIHLSFCHLRILELLKHLPKAHSNSLYYISTQKKTCTSIIEYSSIRVFNASSNFHAPVTHESDSERQPRRDR